MNYLELDRGLNGDYKDAYQRVCTYATMKGYTDELIEEQMNELYDILLTAEKEGKPVRSVIGSDDESFLRGFFSDYGFKERLIDALCTVYRMAVLLLVFAVIDVLASDKPKDMLLNGSFECASIFGGFTSGLIISIISAKFFSPFIGRTKKANMGKWMALVFVMLIVSVGIEMAFIDSIKEKLSFIKISVLPVIVVCGLYITAFLISRAVYRYKNYGTVRNIRKQLYEKNANEHFSREENERIILESWLKKHDKMLKKGKTEQDFEKWAEKTLRSNKQSSKYFTVTLVIIVVAMIITTAIESTVFDTIMFAVIITVVEYFLWRFFIKTFRAGEAAQQSVIDKAKEQGLPLSTYIQNRLEPDNSDEE